MFDKRCKAIYLAIDQGGHGLRCHALNERGQRIAHHEHHTRTRRIARDVVEHDAEELISALFHVIHRCVDQLGTDSRRIVAAALATQRSNIVCWHRTTLRALSPVISWQDRRHAAWFEQHIPPLHAAIQQRTGLRANPHYGASKLRWLWDHQPSLRTAASAGTLCWGPMAAYFIQRLTAAALPPRIDPIHASRTLLWNLDSGDWDPWLLEVFGLPSGLLPQCVGTRSDFGRLRLGALDAPLHVVTGDQNAALWAEGALDEHTAYINIGTGAFVLRPIQTRPARVTPLLISRNDALPSAAKFLIEGTVNGAGSALSWACEQLNIPEERAFEMLRDTPLAITPPLFMNGVSGLGSPWWQAQAPLAFIGTGDAAARLVAVIESIVFLIQCNLDEMSTLGIAAPRQLRVTGGLSRCDRLCRCLADLSGIPLRRPAEREATTRGLVFLLAHAEQRRLSDEAADHFAPTSQPALRERFHDWKAHLIHLLADSSSMPQT